MPVPLTASSATIPNFASAPRSESAIAKTAFFMKVYRKHPKLDNWERRWKVVARKQLVPWYCAPERGSFGTLDNEYKRAGFWISGCDSSNMFESPLANGHLVRVGSGSGINLVISWPPSESWRWYGPPIFISQVRWASWIAACSVYTMLHYRCMRLNSNSFHNVFLLMKMMVYVDRTDITYKMTNRKDKGGIRRS